MLDIIGFNGMLCLCILIGCKFWVVGNFGSIILFLFSCTHMIFVSRLPLCRYFYFDILLYGLFLLFCMCFCPLSDPLFVDSFNYTDD